MKRQKQGFTLAEVLVSLAIIGVIATLTIPQVVNNVLKNRAGVTLGRVVEQVEIGCQNLIQKANDNIKDGGYWEGFTGMTKSDVFETGSGNFLGSNLFINGNAFFDVKEISTSNYLNSIKQYSGETSAGVANSLKVFEMERQDAYIMIGSGTATNDIAGITAYLYIDVNGAAKPNRMGKDVFYFGLTHGGKLVPKETYTTRVVKDGYKIKY